MTARQFLRFTVSLSIFLIAALLFVSGCGDDAPGDPAPGPVVPPPPSEFIKIFGAVYTEQLADSLADLLHPDFQMLLPSETCELWSRPLGAVIDQAEMISIHRNMYSGLAGRDAAGKAIPAVESIAFDVLEPLGTWVPITNETQFFGEHEGLWAKFKINIQFFNTEKTHTYEVQQHVNFYVAEVTSGGNTELQLLGIQGLDNDSKSGTDLTSWEAVLVLYILEPWVVENAYVGSARCGLCHEEIYTDYLVSGHSRPFMSDGAVKSSPGDTDCGRCHTTGYDPGEDTWELDGIACEACHGMGRIHSRSRSAQDIIVNLDEEFCWGCHDIYLSHPYLESGATLRGTSHPGGCVPCHDPHISARLDLERAIVLDCIDCHTSNDKQFESDRGCRGSR